MGEDIINLVSGWLVYGTILIGIGVIVIGPIAVLYFGFQLVTPACLLEDCNEIGETATVEVKDAKAKITVENVVVVDRFTAADEEEHPNEHANEWREISNPNAFLVVAYRVDYIKYSPYFEVDFKRLDQWNSRKYSTDDIAMSENKIPGIDEKYENYDPILGTSNVQTFVAAVPINTEDFAKGQIVMGEEVGEPLGKWKINNVSKHRID